MEYIPPASQGRRQSWSSVRTLLRVLSSSWSWLWWAFHFSRSPVPDTPAWRESLWGPGLAIRKGIAGDQPRRHSTASVPAPPGTPPPRPSAPCSAHASCTVCASEASMCREPPLLRHFLRPGRSGGVYATDKPLVCLAPGKARVGPCPSRLHSRIVGCSPWAGGTQQEAGARFPSDRAGGIPMARDSSPRLGT